MLSGFDRAFPLDKAEVAGSSPASSISDLRGIRPLPGPDQLEAAIVAVLLAQAVALPATLPPSMISLRYVPWSAEVSV
jgi:hypothetical protein